MKLIYKHSTRCGTSLMAKLEVDAFLEKKPENLEYEYVDVLANRPRSNEIEAQLGVVHQSPQAILLSGPRVHWHGSHGEVNRENLSRAFEKTP